MSGQDKAPIPGMRGKMNEGLEITEMLKFAIIKTDCNYIAVGFYMV